MRVHEDFQGLWFGVHSQIPASPDDGCDEGLLKFRIKLQLWRSKKGRHGNEICNAFRRDLR